MFLLLLSAWACSVAAMWHGLEVENMIVSMNGWRKLTKVKFVLSFRLMSAG
jgi:hypothetical protein